ncbi:MAG: D-glycero-beta-D-manno-heptose 1,7-bisphosphate 7-phosphatase [Gammaproteobacteria bacterium]|nr:D-glycero-beta-D-manno-heptose 1,7-bisphosphate 7-phosphatase [Gammaproteobacteria bacterium]
MRKKPLIVLDRDGVINYDSDAFIKTPEEWVALPKSLEAIAFLNRAGYTVTVATNQSGIARGLLDQQALANIHNKMLDEAKLVGARIDTIVYCPHHPDDHCDCRKPLPGLLRQLMDNYSCTPDDLLVVGDSLRDLEAAWAIGAKAILVRTGNGRNTEKKLTNDQLNNVFNDLNEVAHYLTKG